MSPQYLLECPCGESVKVEPRQAGDRVRCDCGVDLEVPSLTHLRRLLRADDAPPAAGGTWGLREGLLAVALISVVALAAVGGYLWLTEPPSWTERSDISVETWTPRAAWEYWCLIYRPLTTGRAEDIASVNPAIERQIELYRLGRWTCLALAGVAAVVGCYAAAMGPVRK